MLNELRNRGVEDILIACCDGLKGFPEAIEAVFPRTTVQTCIVHMIRNSLKYVGYKERKIIAAALKPVYTAPSESAAVAALDEFEQEWGERYPIIVQSWRSNWERVTPVLDYPPEIRKILYTTNAIESLKSMIRKLILIPLLNRKRTRITHLWNVSSIFTPLPIPPGNSSTKYSQLL